MDALPETKACEVCGAGSLEPVLDLGKHPLCDDLVPVGESRVCREYPIEILFCRRCATAHQRFGVPKREVFPENYHYRARFTADVLNGMSSLVDSCEKRLAGLKGKLVLDIGCNDGSLLDFFKAKGARTIGVEPTGAVADAAGKGHALFDAFFDGATADAILKAHGPPDVITFTNVFAHIENLGELLAAVKKLLSPAAALVIENHYLGAVLDRGQFDTFYHEHPRTYSFTSFTEIAKTLGCAVLGAEFPSRYGGNIRVFMSPTGAGIDLPELRKEEQGYSERFAELRRNIDRWRKARRGFFADLARKGERLPAKAFPGRAAILIKLLGADEKTIAEIYEKPGSKKIGHYVPGTRIPIRSDDELFKLAPKPARIVNLAWHISNEIRAYLQANGFTGEVIDIVGPEDF